MHYRHIGFTLLEVVVVLLVVAAIVAISVPRLEKSREAGRRSVCADNLKAIHACLILYEQTEGMFPTRAQGNSNQYNSGDAQEALNLLYRQYTDDVRILSCPSIPLSASMLSEITPSTTTGWPNVSGTAFKQAPPGTEGISTSYGYSPGHNSSQKRVVIVADRQGIGPKGNSDNHGADAGQNVLAAMGAVIFINFKQNMVSDSNSSVDVYDSDIYSDNTVVPNSYVDWESFCR